MLFRSMLLSAVTSFLVGDRGARFNLNKFTWTPILEVGALFTWSLRRLVPILVSMVLIFMTGSLWWMLLGVLVGLVILGPAGRDLRAAKAVKADCIVMPGTSESRRSNAVGL